MCLPLEAYWDFLIYFLRYFSTELSIKKSKKQNCNKMTKTFLITSHLDVVYIFHTLLFPTLHRCSSMASEFNFPPKNLCLPKFSWLWCFPIFRKMRILATYLVNVNLICQNSQQFVRRQDFIILAKTIQRWQSLFLGENQGD